MTLHDDYDLERDPFALGVTSRLYRCRSRRHNKDGPCVAKLFDKNKLTERRAELVRNEAAIGTQLPPSPHLVHTLHYYDEVDVSHAHHTPTGYVCIVMEYLSGGSLLDRIRARGPLRENQARSLVRDVLKAVSTMHAAHTMHRDIKPENVFFRRRETNASGGAAAAAAAATTTGVHGLPSSSSSSALPTRMTSKDSTSTMTEGESRDGGECAALGDFGFATNVVPSSDYVGSPQYSAPEMALIALKYHTQSKVKPVYGEKCDIWSVGVLTFVMLTGLLPFDGANPTEVFTKVIRNDMPFELVAKVATSAGLPGQRAGTTGGVSSAAKAFILELTKTHPAARPSAQEALRHQWLAIG